MSIASLMSSLTEKWYLSHSHSTFQCFQVKWRWGRECTSHNEISATVRCLPSRNTRKKSGELSGLCLNDGSPSHLVSEVLQRSNWSGITHVYVWQCPCHGYKMFLYTSRLLQMGWLHANWMESVGINISCRWGIRPFTRVLSRHKLFYFHCCCTDSLL
jgi:hypothetical protein